MDLIDKVLVEYIWIGGNGSIRSKTKVITTNGTPDISELPDWNYDGSSTDQATGTDSEVVIIPRRITRCPFRRGNNIMVMCDTYKPSGEPLPTNHRVWAKQTFDKKLSENPWFGLEQEFFLMDYRTDRPLGFNGESFQEPVEQGQYYCSVGADNAFGREIVEESLANMLYAGLTVSGINAEVAPGQWEYQIGPVSGIDAGDQLWLSRYILQRTAERHNVHINYDPKPLSGNWNGSGLHTNYSTCSMRSSGGLSVIEKAIDKLSEKHKEHMAVYGIGNNLRMTGECETASFDKFTCGRANRGASVRIGNDTIKQGCGYFEDRRPAANADPYLVTAKLFETTVL